MEVDLLGNIYIADALNGRIRKVSVDGIINTIAGTGLGFFGDGGRRPSALLNNPIDVDVDAEGNLFIADEDNQRIRKVSPSGIITTVAGSGLRAFRETGVWPPTPRLMSLRESQWIRWATYTSQS